MEFPNKKWSKRSDEDFLERCEHRIHRTSTR